MTNTQLAKVLREHAIYAPDGRGYIGSLHIAAWRIVFYEWMGGDVQVALQHETDHRTFLLFVAEALS